MQAFLYFEGKRFWKDIKNKVAALIFIALSLYLAIGIERNFEPVRSFDPVPIEATLQDANYFLETRDASVYERSFKVFRELQEISKDLLDALDDKDYREAILLEAEYYGAMNARFEGENPKYYLYGEDFSERMQLQIYDEISYMNYSEALVESDLYLTQEIVEGKTVTQALARSWLGVLPLLVLVLGLVYGLDFFADESKHETIAHAFPLSPYKKSWVRTLVVWFSSVLILFLGELSFIFTLLMFRKWGGIDLWVTEIIESVSVGTFLLQGHLLIMLALLILLRIGSWTGQIVKNSLVIFLLIPALVLPYLLDIGRKSEFVDLFEWFPLSFFQVGNIISGFQNFWYARTVFTFPHEVLLLAAGFFFVEIIIYITLTKFPSIFN